MFALRAPISWPLAADGDGGTAKQPPPKTSNEENNMKTLITTTLLALATLTQAQAQTAPTRDDIMSRADSLRWDSLERTLGEAVVTARRPVAKIEGDALVTTVQNTYLARLRSGEDVLANIPGLTKNQDGYEVTGKGAPVFYINGRQVRDNSELAQLRADEIKSVEVVRNPGARYDATVNAVVRIRTVRRQGEGFGVDATGTYSQGRYASGDGSLHLTYRKRNFDLFGDVYGNTGHNFFESLMDQQVKVDTLWSQHTLQNIKAHWKYAGGKAGFNWDINEKHSVGARYELSRSIMENGDGYLRGEILADGVHNDELNSDVKHREKGDLQHQLNVYYVGQLGRGELSIDADFFAGGKNLHIETQEYSAEHDDRTVTSDNPVRNRLAAGKAQYAFPLWRGRFAFGAQYTNTNRHDYYIVPVPQYGLATAYSQLKEQNAAAFAEYSAIVGRFQLGAGLRYEHVDFDYYDNGVRQPDQSRKYDRLFPNLSAATQWKGVQWMLSYNVKTRRPSYSELSNNVTYGNRYLMQSGNPLLRPVITHDVTLMGVWKFLQGVVTFKKEKDQIINWGESLPDNPSATKIYNVNQDIPSMHLMLTVAPKVGCWRPSWTFVGMKQWLTMQMQEGEISFNNPMAVVQWNNAFELPGGFLLNANAYYASPGNFQNIKIRTKDYVIIGASLQKSWLKDALSVTVGGEDFLHKAGDNMPHIYMYRSELTQGGQYDSRKFYVTVRYRFNVQRSKYKGKGAAGDELNRL